MPNPVSFGYFQTCPEVIQLAVILYMRFPLSSKALVADLITKDRQSNTDTRVRLSDCTFCYCCSSGVSNSWLASENVAPVLYKKQKAERFFTLSL